MAKICTDINQSKRLQKLGLKPGTADMCYRWHDNRYYCVSKDVPYPYSLKDPVPAWSLPKLLELLPHAIQEFHPYKAWGLNMSLRYSSLQYVTDSLDDVKETKIFWDINGTEIIDSVVDMAVWLAENGYLWKNGEFRNIKENKEKRI